VLTREKAILATLQEAGRPVSSLVLTKLIFLMRQETGIATKMAGFYEFVPYKFGPYSFALHKDLAGLKRNGYVETSGDDWRLGHFVDQGRDWRGELDQSITAAIRLVYASRRGLSRDELLRDVYSRYPWFASQSELRELVPRDTPTVKPGNLAVYTAGYQQKTIDGFLSGLLRNGIKCIVDVRSNPISRNYGFAGRTLSNLAGKLGLQYKHFPQLGIPSSERKDLDSAVQYEVLFTKYRETVLRRESASISTVAALMHEKPSALLCYEANPHSCHRSHLALAIQSVSKLELVHLL